MGFRKWIKNNENKIWAMILTILLGVVLAACYDFYYDLNDDVLMKNLLSGGYTGTPESRNIQMLYPLSFIIGLFYKILPTLPVYGIFLVGCQFFSIYLVTERVLSFCSKVYEKFLLCLVVVSFVLGVFLPHMIFIQYTVTCGFLVGTATFLFLTKKKADSLQGIGKFIKSNLLSILLLLVAFMMRTEMLLLLFPLVCVAGVYQWFGETIFFSADIIKKYLLLFGILVVGMLTAVGINKMAYSSQEWKTFMAFFDARTELYDYQQIPPYEGNETFYEALGLSKEEVTYLFVEYNFGMEENADANMLLSLAERNETARGGEKNWLEQAKEKLAFYRYRTFHKQPDDYPWNYLVLLSYFFVVMLGLLLELKKGKGVVKRTMFLYGKLLLLLVVRSGLWLFILMGERDPIRITHPLYLMELFMLWATLLGMWGESPKSKDGLSKVIFLCPLLLGLLMFVSVPLTWAQTRQTYEEREKVNGTHQAFLEYCKENPNSFFWMDVYSTVPYSEKMFTMVDHSPANYDIMGGWACKSPLYDKKLDYFKLPSMRESLLKKETVFYVVEWETGTKSLEVYCESIGCTVEIEQLDTINDVLGIYKVTATEVREG